MLERRFKISTFVRQTRLRLELVSSCGVLMKAWLFPSPLGFLLSCHEKHNQSTAKRHGHHIVSALPLGKGPAPARGCQNYAEPWFFYEGGLEAWATLGEKEYKIKFVCRTTPGYWDNTNQLRPWASWQASTLGEPLPFTWHSEQLEREGFSQYTPSIIPNSIKTSVCGLK